MLSQSLSGNNNEPLKWRIENDYDLGSEYSDLIYERLSVSELKFKLSNEKNSQFNVTLFPFDNDVKILEWQLDNFKHLKYDIKSNNYKDLIKSKVENVDCVFKGFDLINCNQEKVETSIISDFKFDYDFIGAYRSESKIGGYQIPSNKKEFKVGMDGSKAYDILFNDLLFNNSELLDQVANWYMKNFEGWKIEIDFDSIRKIAFFNLSRNNPRYFTTKLNYVGQGISQILPLITSSFFNHQKPILTLIEEPELHLHPSAHGDLAERFVESVKLNSNKNYLIETHSENFILRLRRLIAEKKFDFSLADLSIYYINYDEENNESNIEEVEILENGDVLNWPEGIFNESLEEVILLRKAQKN
jgi:hypothetical protein